MNFNRFMQASKSDWWYQKFIQEAYRAVGFEYYHYSELFKAVNYKVQKRIILSLSEFLRLEVILTKLNYFRNIDYYYTRRLLNLNIEYPKPHTIDKFITLPHIVTEYFPQSPYRHQ